MNNLRRNNNHNNGAFKFLLLILLGFLIWGGIHLYRVHKTQIILQTQIADLLRDRDEEPKKEIIKPTIITTESSAESWIEVQQRLRNTVVKIITHAAAFNWLEPYKTPEMRQGSGSGFFINKEGDIVTNFHVVNQANLIQIEVPALGLERLEVEIRGVSPERDLALLKLTDDTKERIEKALGGKIPYLRFGDSDEIKMGQTVLALGYPLDVQSLKGTQGIVSGKERLPGINRSCIQTTAPLNPGNSGGPSVNPAGEVIGINFAGVIEAQNVGYILPINDLKNAIKDLYKVKLLRNPTLGCSLQGANEDMVRYLGNPMPGGYFVTKAFKNMMLEKAGGKEGDMIYEINGFKIDRFGRATVLWNEDKVSIADIIDRLEVGDKVDMVIYRKGEYKEIEFMLEPRFLPPVRFVYPDFEEVDYENFGGFVFMDLAQNHLPFLAQNSHQLIEFESLEKQYEPTLIVSYIQPTSLASKMRIIAPGMIVEEINGEKVNSLKDLRQAAKKSSGTGYFTIRTKDNLNAVLSITNILNDEDRLSKLYSFKKSKLLDYMV